MEDVGVSAHVHPKVAPKVLDTPNRVLRTLEGKLVTLFHNDGVRKERRKMLLARYRSTARATTTMRGREGLMQVDVHNVKAEVAWANMPDQCIQVCAVAIHQTTHVVYHLADLKYVRLK